jgi:hypothetical protein
VKRWTVLAVLAGIVIAMAGAPAYAKGFAGATIQGGGTTVEVPNRAGTGGLEDLAEVTRAWAFLGDGQVVLEPEPEPAVRGPAYVVSYRIDADVFRQELYPDSSAGSLIYTPPGQALFGLLSRGGWTESGVNLALFLRAYGIRATDQRAVVPSQDGGPGWLPVSATAAGVAVVLLAGGLLVLRRRRSAARSSMTT